MSSISNHDEGQFYRVVAAATPVAHNIFGTVPNKGTFPLPATMTGTITSDPASTGTDNQKVVFGTGTLFTSEVRIGDYIYAGDVVRKVVAIANNTQLTLEYKFPSAVSAAALKIVRPGRFRRIKAKNTGAGVAIYQEAKMGTAEESDRASSMGLTPVSYDVSGANGEIIFELSE